MIKLQDSQIWECETGVVQVQKMGKAFGDFRGIVFKKDADGAIHYVSMLYNEKDRLAEFIKSLNMKNTGKRIVTKEKADV